MQDRVPTPGKENRVRIRLDDGQTIEGVLEYADEPSVQGSAYNKANVLPDEVCDALGIPTSSEPKDAFSEIFNSFSDFKGKIEGRIIHGTYNGNSTTNGDYQNISLGFEPLIIILYPSGKGARTSEDIYIGVCYKSFGLMGYDGKNQRYDFAVSITQNGFKVVNVNPYKFNYSGFTYSYIAIKGLD